MSGRDGVPGCHRPSEWLLLLEHQRHDHVEAGVVHIGHDELGCLHDLLDEHVDDNDEHLCGADGLRVVAPAHQVRPELGGGGDDRKRLPPSGFLITNTGTVACTIEGYPGLLLVPASGQVSPVVRRVGQTPRVVTLKAGGEAAFTIEYGDEPVDGQQTCPTIVGLDVTLPQSGGAVSVTARFSPCGAPNLNVSEVLSLALYHQSF
jgi:hypothetical protein